LGKSFEMAWYALSLGSASQSASRNKVTSGSCQVSREVGYARRSKAGSGSKATQEFHKPSILFIRICRIPLIRVSLAFMRSAPTSCATFSKLNVGVTDSPGEHVGPRLTSIGNLCRCRARYPSGLHVDSTLDIVLQVGAKIGEPFLDAKRTSHQKDLRRNDRGGVSYLATRSPLFIAKFFFLCS
jgi:hypothetical protein